MPMVYCLVACSWLGKFSTGCTLSTGFLWLLVTDFFVHWQSGFLCSTLRHRFARSVPWHGWCLVRTSTSTAILPKRTARPTGFHAPQCTMCVGLPRKSVHTLGSRLLAPETPSGWCVGIVGTAPPGTEEVSQPSAARHVTPSTATGHCLSSTGAVKQFRQVFLNLELWSRALGSGLRRRRRWQWRRQGGLPGRRTSRRPPPSPLRSPPSGRRRWRGEWPTSQQLWTWSSSRRT